MAGAGSNMLRVHAYVKLLAVTTWIIAIWPFLSGGRRGPPEAPCAAQQCGNGAPALLVSISTDFPNEYG